MAAPLVERSTGDVIPAYDHNDVKDYIEDGTYRVNTLSLNIQGYGEIIDSSANVTANSVSVATDQKINFEGAAGDTYLKFNSTTSKLELFVNNTKKADWG